MIGTRVLVKSLGIKGTIEYVDRPNIHRDHLYPIQVRLDRPWYGIDGIDGQNAYMYRTFRSDLTKIKKKGRIASIKDEIRTFLKWLDSY